MNTIYLLLACEFFSGDTFEVGAFSTHDKAEAVKAEYEARQPLEIAHYTIRPVDFDQPANPKWFDTEEAR